MVVDLLVLTGLPVEEAGEPSCRRRTASLDDDRLLGDDAPDEEPT